MLIFEIWLNDKHYGMDNYNIVAAFRGMHVSAAKHSCA